MLDSATDNPGNEAHTSTTGKKGPDSTGKETRLTPEKLQFKAE